MYSRKRQTYCVTFQRDQASLDSFRREYELGVAAQAERCETAALTTAAAAATRYYVDRHMGLGLVHSDRGLSFADLQFVSIAGTDADCPPIFPILNFCVLAACCEGGVS